MTDSDIPTVGPDTYRIVLTAQIGDYIARRINSFKPTPEHPCFVLGLPTGSSPLPVYRRLVELYKEGKVSFKDVITCKHGMHPNELHS